MFEPRRVAVFGLGYVGSVLAAGLAASGHTVIGVDRVREKVATLGGGEPVVHEPGLRELVADSVRTGRLRATNDPHEAVAGSDVALVCVGTPADGRGGFDLDPLERVCVDIGRSIRSADAPYVVLVRSTVMPGTMRNRVVPWLVRSAGRDLGAGLAVGVQPEFLREGDALADLRWPTLSVVGTADATDDAASRMVRALEPEVRFEVVGFETAECLKLANNAFHATKICFANEIASLAHTVGADGRAVMELLASDDRLNASGAYLRPGSAFGGSCLAKDVAALEGRSVRPNLDVPLLRALLPSNDAHLARTVDQVRASGARRVGIIGVAFKAETDDMRESVALRLARSLVASGIEVRWWDPLVEPDRILGANRAAAGAILPNWDRLRCADPDDLLDWCDVVVGGHAGPVVLPYLTRARDDGRLVDPLDVT